MSRLAYVSGLGNGILLVSYTDEYEEEKFQALYSKEDAMSLAMEGMAVSRILHVTEDGLLAELTIAFEDGKLDLIRKPKPEVEAK